MLSNREPVLRHLELSAPVSWAVFRTSRSQTKMSEMGTETDQLDVIGRQAEHSTVLLGQVSRKLVD
jgi:hypothetical protein